VIASVGHHADRTLIDDVAAISCSTPTHAAEAAVPIDCRAARGEMTARARRLHDHSRRAILGRARTLGHLARAPHHHVARHRRHLHQLLRELRASANRTCERGRSRASVHLLVLSRAADRARSSDQSKRRRELERLALALAAHDPARTLARGYVLVEDRAGQPLVSTRAAREAGDVRLRFHDGKLDARVTGEERSG
jgi:exodeoxyribonuclease VII large subunit